VTATTAAECGSHLLSKIRSAESVEKEVDHVVGCGDDVGDLFSQNVRQVFGSGALGVGVLGKLVQCVGDGVGETEADECHTDGHQHEGQLALGRSAMSTSGNSVSATSFLHVRGSAGDFHTLV